MVCSLPASISSSHLKESIARKAYLILLEREEGEPAFPQGSEHVPRQETDKMSCRDPAKLNCAVILS